jgi:hypothetical protein
MEARRSIMLELYAHQVPTGQVTMCPQKQQRFRDKATPVCEFGAGSRQSRRTTLADTEGLLTHAREVTTHIKDVPSAEMGNVSGRFF